jgi:hypothetical protein
MNNRIRALGLGGWGFALVLAVLGLFRAVGELAHGWWELPFHWWSTLAAVAVLVAAGGFILVLVGVGSSDPMNADRKSVV